MPSPRPISRARFLDQVAGSGRRGAVAREEGRILLPGPALGVEPLLDETLTVGPGPEPVRPAHSVGRLLPDHQAPAGELQAVGEGGVEELIADTPTGVDPEQ